MKTPARDAPLRIIARGRTLEPLAHIADMRAFLGVKRDNTRAIRSWPIIGPPGDRYVVTEHLLRNHHILYTYETVREEATDEQ